MLRRLIDRINYHGFMLVGTTYVAAASLIGFETLAVLLGYATIWPVGIPLIAMGIGAYALVRRRRQDDDDVQ
jgi:Na+/proline symporter